MKRAAFTVMVCALIITNAQAATTNTAQILSATTQATGSCIKWKLIGICLWLKCGSHGCKIKTSPRISNYAPDVVVTVHNDASSHPWTEIRPVVSATTSSMASLLGSVGDSSGAIERRQAGRGAGGRERQSYRDGDVIGHPMSALNSITGFGGLVCASRTRPLFPYFISPTDALAWRMILPVESLYPASLVPGVKEIGSWPTNTWGNVYPRTGVVVQQEEPKVSAVIAQRAGDIVTRSGQPHVYTPLTYNQRSPNRMKYWNPPALQPNDADTGVWQMLLPKTDSSCYVFGKNDAVGITSWSDGRRDPAGDYQYNLWRPYKCCRKRGKYLGHIP